MLHVLSAGAAQGLIEALQLEFGAVEGIDVRASFHPVGETRAKLLAGEPCDVVVLTAPMLDQLSRAGDVRPDSVAPLGSVHTGIAMRAGDAAPEGAFELATLYCVAVAARAQQPESAQRFAALLAGPASDELRRRCGFEF